MKRTLALLLSILGACSLAVTSMAVDGPMAEYESGEYTYTVDADGNAVITSYFGDDARIVVPAELDGHTVAAVGDGAFPDYEDIVSVSLPAGIRAIGPGAFEGCYPLSSIEVSPDNPVYTSADGVLFRKIDQTLIAYPSMKEGNAYSVPQGTLAIGDGAFDSCYALQSVSLPDSLQTIGIDAFSRCSHLASIRVSTGNPCFTSADGVLFRTEDHALIAYPQGKTEETYSVPQGTLAIGDRVFYECSFTAVTLPDSLQTIGNRAFYNCRNLISVNLPSGLQTIGDRAFAYCRNLASVSLPASLQSVGSEAFADCRVLIIGSLPGSLRFVGDGAFAGCVLITGFAVPPDHPVFSSVDGVLFDTVNQVLVAYPSGKTGETYAVPQITKAVGGKAFAGCSSLASVGLPDGLMSIGGRAFENCTSLAFVSLPECIPSVAEGTFYNCSSLASVSLPDGLESIGDWAFGMCEALTSVSLPDGLLTIGDHAFDDCRNLTSVNLPDSVQSLGDWAFYCCYSLESVSLPDGLQRIGNGVFNNSSLTSILLPDGIESIGEETFRYCYSLSSVSMPGSLRSIGRLAFSDCWELTSIDFPDGLQTISDYAFSQCLSLDSVSLPAGLESIGAGIFSNCQYLSAIEVPPDNPVYSSLNGVLFDKECKTLIAYPGGKPGETYSVPQGAQAIGDMAFESYKALTSVILPESLRFIGEYAFACSDSLTLLVPRGSYAHQYAERLGIPYQFAD